MQNLNSLPFIGRILQLDEYLLPKKDCIVRVMRHGCTRRRMKKQSLGEAFFGLEL
jgi:hypothetical protein